MTVAQDRAPTYVLTVADTPRSLPAAQAGVLLEKALAKQGLSRPVTVADASAASGLPLRDAEAGLAWLTAEYRGHLRVTEDGDLLHVFPHGFTKPWERREALERLWASVSGALLAAGRFVVRAWLLIVMVAYALVFVGVLIGLTFARGSQDDRDHGHGVSIVGGLLRMIADALFWTFHPFSPLYVEPGAFRDARSAHEEEEEEQVRFYEKVNRFVFGPPTKKEDPRAVRARVLEEIRARRGRIGLADVMRVTGLPREEADPMMARLMLDHDGTVDVGEQGGIVYRFEAMRRTADDSPSRPQPPAWERPKELEPLTGNSAAANVGIAALNLFNVLASAWIIANGLTIENIAALFAKPPPATLPGPSTPLALGVVPLVFSLALFTIPLARAVKRRRDERRVAADNARLAILREVLARAPRKEPVPHAALESAWRVAAGEEPSPKEITRRVVELGGDVDVGPEGEVRYRFVDLEAETEALEDERARATDDEARVGRVIFASDA